MNDRALSLLEHYDIEVLRSRKGRGTFICDTNSGSVILKEYSGNPQKLLLQQQLLEQIRQKGLVRTEMLLPDREGQLFVKDGEGSCYILKTWEEGSECNIYDGRECVEAIRLLARLHLSMQPDRETQSMKRGQPAEGACATESEHPAEGVCVTESEHPAEGACATESVQPTEGVQSGETVLPLYSPLKEYEKHNRELARVWTYLKKKGQKQVFEIRLLSVMEHFTRQARAVTEHWRPLEQERLLELERMPEQKRPLTFCHGDYQHHNILKTRDGWYLVNFEKMQADDPIRDIYLFMRKVMEKNNWLEPLGRELLTVYESIRPLEDYSRTDLYYRFAYPEKFWKIANFYYNSGKAWIPEKNLEKLEKVIRQEEEKQTFLRAVFQRNA